MPGIGEVRTPHCARCCWPSTGWPTSRCGWPASSPKTKSTSTYEPNEIAGLLAESRREGLLAPAEHARLAGALALDEDTARSVMVPVERLVTVPWHVSAAELEERVLETGYSRFPVCGANEGVAGAVRLVGFVHAKDVLEVSPGSRHVPLPPRRLRRMVDVEPEIRLSGVLGMLRRAGTHLGRVVDADGTALGVVTLDDVLARFVGETGGGTVGGPVGGADGGPDDGAADSRAGPADTQG